MEYAFNLHKTGQSDLTGKQKLRIYKDNEFVCIDIIDFDEDNYIRYWVELNEGESKKMESAIYDVRREIENEHETD